MLIPYHYSYSTIFSGISDNCCNVNKYLNNRKKNRLHHNASSILHAFIHASCMQRERQKSWGYSCTNTTHNTRRVQSFERSEHRQQQQAAAAQHVTQSLPAAHNNRAAIPCTGYDRCDLSGLGLVRLSKMLNLLRGLYNFTPGWVDTGCPVEGGKVT